MTEVPKPTTPRQAEFPASKEPAVRWFIIGLVLVAMGGWCLVDAYVFDKYPAPAQGEEDYTNKFMKYLFNHWGPVLFVPLGLVCFAVGGRAMRQVLIVDAAGVGYAGKAKHRWEQVKELDRSKLDDKGLLVLHFDDGESLTLDSWKLKYFRELLEFLEARCPGGEGLLAAAEASGE